MIGAVAAVVCIIACVIYVKLNNVYKYWERRGVKGPKPRLLYGNYEPVIKQKCSESSLVDQIYKGFRNEKVVGMYQGIKPMLLIRDPELIKLILIKDFANFVDRGLRVTDNRLSKNLFTASADDWRILRPHLTPVFTSGKLKQMMPLMNTCVEQYIEYLNEIVEQQSSWEVRGLNTKYTIKGITSIAFGLDIDPFNEEENEFHKVAKKIFEPDFIHFGLFLLHGFAPEFTRKLHFLNVRENQIVDFFSNLVNEIVKAREGKPKVRRDFMDFMIELKENIKIKNIKEEGAPELEITNTVMATQAFALYTGGFETSSTTMSFLFHELAFQPSIQERCYQEIKGAMEKHNGTLSFEAVNELEYNSMVMEEAMRKYPVVATLHRQCLSDYKLPGTNFTLEKGTKLLISNLALHNDPQYFPDPEKFDPERFAPGRRESIPSGTYLPFGDGPRNCIGLRFAKIQTLLGVAHFLYNFRVEPCEKTERKVTLGPAQFTLIPTNGLWLKIIKRNNKVADFNK